MRTAGGIEGFALVPTGPFGKGRGLVYTDYDNGTLTLVALDPATRNPLTDQSGNIMTMPLMSGITGPVDVEFDPLTGDMFIADYGTGATTTSVALLQFEGAIQGGFDGNFHKYGAGCPTKSAAIPTLTANTQLTAGVGITFIMSSAPVSQPTSFLVFGVGDTGNIGGFLFGGTTCRVYVNPMLSVPFATNSSGVASIAFTIPLAAKGVSVFAQAWALSPGANSLNLTVSDAGCSIIK
jgi:hypothetical protein